MSWDNELTPLLVHTVTIEPWTGQDVDGKPTYGAAVSYAAKVEARPRLVRTPEGHVIATRGVVYLQTTSVPSTKDRLTLPSGFGATQPPIAEVQIQTDEDGVHHCEVWF